MVQLITVSSAIPYISEINSTSSSLKKKKNLEKEKGRRKEKKRECEREGKGEGKREERRERERREGRRGENRESGTKISYLNTPPSPGAFPSPVPSSDGTRE